MRSVVRRVQFVNRLMRLESDYSDGQGRKEERKDVPKEGMGSALRGRRIGALLGHSHPSE